MDWQQATALAIVATTAILFVRARSRRRRGGCGVNPECGCAAQPDGKGPRVVFRARKGRATRVWEKGR